ncbi:EscU/YscU/HrcU family type III secretion system export apparatus switch protein [Aneurinibacillus sp. Ricciae_BoGa-3]|uniref:EscU/YscU/HrcU family type III secretion system export apparatus switch protein n=1 Tax=Aneurinibacillus sp. Ricciae_BoGa-3 TaxID=3022697 RepID=UPI0023408898|nr:EscU/YscU/HrcU family type III secretion system export apparatus switch protein [Aneurinibacillus sp. Ricciae_BoGa-3]WCK52919.1 EscU/YscU/HrcU family type III secretion system export apparatus switch protein [Aneurinibacillus sp. Ricciae_BoGa-3]
MKKRKEAVAIRYNPEEAEAPYVVAKGKGIIAENILAQAQQNNVPVQEDPSLVQLLGQLELNQQIPGELYQVVAEILAFVYRTDRRAID